MSCLPRAGRIACNLCYGSDQINFDSTRIEKDRWRITANPLAWGNQEPEIVVLGFSKGPTQAGALLKAHHDAIAFKGSRLNVGKILAHIGVLKKGLNQELTAQVDQAIANPSGRFHFGSLIRCTVERYDEKSTNWKGSGGGMLDKFVATSFGQTVASNCTKTFLGNLASPTKLVIMFGLGSKQNYVRESYKLFKAARPGSWKWINGISYTDGAITVVHVEHFAAQGALIPNWLGKNDHPRSEFGLMARSAVAAALSS
jgi:hypothetical protein